MKFLSNSLSAAKSLAGIILLFALSAQLHAAAMLSLSGSAMDVKYENDTEVRLSLIDWSSVEERAEVEKAYREYQKNNDLEEEFDKSIKPRVLEVLSENFNHLNILFEKEKMSFLTKTSCPFEKEQSSFLKRNNCHF